MMEERILQGIKDSLRKFTKWLNQYGEISYDHQSFFAGTLGRRAKALYYKSFILGKLAVAPMVFCEGVIPWARRFFWHPQRFPIADAHYSMGFSFLSKVFKGNEYYRKAVHFLNVLEETRCTGYKEYCWGYPFDWETRNGTVAAGTPLITITPYIYEAFYLVYQIDQNAKWVKIMRSIAEHAMHDIKDYELSDGTTACSYTPFDRGGVVNASAYRAFLLASASKLFCEDRYWKIAEGNLNFVLKSQLEDGSWPYAIDSKRGFIDHFHTCFILKALAKIEKLTGHARCRKAIDKGVEYYLKNLFDRVFLPKPFSKAPRLTIYRRELYDYAECINLGILLKNRYEELERVVLNVISDLLRRWQKPDGSFRSRELLLGFDNLPMHRWAQSQIFRSLCYWCLQEVEKKTSNHIGK